MSTNNQPLFTLSEQDIRMFLQAAPQRPSFWRRFLLQTVSLAGASAVVFVLLNIQAFIQLSTSSESGTGQVLAQSSITAAPSAPMTSQAPATPAPTPTPELQLPTNTINIDSLGISAPITWNVPLEDQPVHDGLEHGVIQIKGTALPGQKGMAVISGHSSNYIWDKGQYNTIFAPLRKLAIGQEIDLNYNNQIYTYQVSKMYEVKPTDLSVLQDDSQAGLRLITCTPIGTALRRLIVDAVQVTPDPATAAPFTAQQFSGPLPNAK